MTTPEIQQLKELIQDLKRDVTKRMDELDAKVDRAADFQSGLQGAAKVGMWIMLFVAAAVAIYAGLHGIYSPGGSK